MRVIIAGTRDLPCTIDWIEKAVRTSGFRILEIVSGHSGNVDMAGEKWAYHNHIRIDSYPVPHWVWKKLGKVAGPLRNASMAEESDALILIWNGKSRGSLNMKQEAEKRNLLIYEEIRHG